jgi:hypothetical protein
MDGGRTARDRSRGGRVIQAFRQARTRLTLTACGGAVGLSLAAYAAAFAERGGLLLLALGLVATAVAATGAIRGSAPLLVAGVGGLVVEYAVAAGEQGFELDTRAALWGSSLLLMAELVFLAAELRDAVPGGDLVARRLATTFGVVIASVVLGAVLLGVAEVPAGGGLALQLAGVAAAAGVLALVLSLARR